MTTTAVPDMPADLFKGVKYYLLGHINEQVTALLDKGGGKRDNYLGEMVSHVIADNADHDEYCEAKELFDLPVVTSKWVMLSVACRKQLPIEPFCPEGRIFSGVVACASDLDPEDSESLWGMLTYNGAHCISRLDSTCTHLITSKTDGVKYEAAIKHGYQIKVVTPDWVIESLNVGRVTDEGIYHPRLSIIPKSPSPPKPPSPIPIPTDIINMEPLPRPPPQLLHMPFSAASGMPPGPYPGAPAPIRMPSQVPRGARGGAPKVRSRVRHPQPPGMPGMRPRGLKTRPSRLPSPGMMPMPPGPSSLSPHGKPQQMLPGFHSPMIPPMGFPGMLPPDPNMGYNGPFMNVDMQAMNTKEALARLVNNRIQAQGVKGLDSPEKSPIPGMASFPSLQMLPGMGQGLAAFPPMGHPDMGGFGMGGHPLHHQIPQVPSLPSPGLPPHMFMSPAQVPQDTSSPLRTLRNITNNSESIPAPPLSHVQNKPTSAKVNQILGLKGPPPQGHSHPPQSSLGLDIRLDNGEQSPGERMYYAHEEGENGFAFPQDMCLLGCVFYIADYEKVLGEQQILIWRRVIEQYGGLWYPAFTNRITHVMCPNQHCDIFALAMKEGRRLVSAYWLNDVLVKKHMTPPWEAIHLPVIYSDTHKPCSNQVICVSGFEGDERIRLKQMVKALGAKYTGYHTHTNSVLICKVAAGKKYAKAREWKIPVVNVKWLTDLLLGDLNALRLPVNEKYCILGQPDPFALDLSKVTHLMVGWQHPIKISKEAWKKFSPSGKLRQSHEALKRKAEANNEDEDIKKLKDDMIMAVPVPGMPRILFTGYTGKMLRKLKQCGKQLGAAYVESPQLATHLVAKSLARTVKMFQAINMVKFIVSKDWLEDSRSQGCFVDEGKYVLKDRQAEMELNCDLAESLRRAHTTPLFQHITFNITPSIQPSVEELTEIIESASGTVIHGRPSLRSIQTSKNHKGEPTFVVITCANDLHLVKDLLSKNIAVYNAEFVLTGVLRQEIDFELFKLQVQIR